MQQLRRSFSLAAGVGVIVIVLTATGAGSAIAQGARPLLTFIVNDASSPVPVRSVGSTLTHLGRPAGDIVQLSWWASGDCFRRFDPTGLGAPDCYVPPAGRTVIITDVQWLVGTEAGGSVLLYIYDRGMVFVGSTVGDSRGVASLDHRSQTGFIFAPSLKTYPGGTTLLRGYVVPE